MSWKRWLKSTGGWQSRLLLFLVWLIIPGGTIIVTTWLLAQEVRADKELTDDHHTSFKNPQITQIWQIDLVKSAESAKSADPHPLPKTRPVPKKVATHRTVEPF